MLSWSKNYIATLCQNNKRTNKKKITFYLVSINQMFCTCIYLSIRKITPGKNLPLSNYHYKANKSSRTMYDFHDSTDTLKFWTEKQAINKTFLFFHLILMKFGEVVITHVNYNFTKFHQNRMENKKVLLIECFSVQNFKVSVELWKSYIVHRVEKEFKS